MKSKDFHFCFDKMPIVCNCEKKGRSWRSKIEGGSLFAHRATSTTCAAHSLELKVKASLKFISKLMRWRAKI